MDEDQKHYDLQGAAIAAQKIAEIELQFKRQALWYQAKFGSLIAKLAGGRVLDAPCGHGNFLYYLRSAGVKNFKGIDISLDRIAVAKSLGLPAAHGDIFSTITQESNLSLIACIDFLEHVEKGRVPEFIASCKKALTSQGVLLLRMPVGDSIFGSYDAFNDFTHKWAANSNVIEALLKQAGFGSVSILDERPMPYSARGMLRLPLYGLLRGLHSLKNRTFGYSNYRVWSRSAWFVARSC